MDFFHICGGCGAALFVSLILRAVVSISEGGTLTLRKCIRPQNEVAAQLLINVALCGGSRPVCVLGRLWGRGF